MVVWDTVAMAMVVMAMAVWDTVVRATVATAMAVWATVATAMAVWATVATATEVTVTVLSELPQVLIITMVHPTRTSIMSVPLQVTLATVLAASNTPKVLL